MLRQIEKKTPFMEKVEAVAKQHGVEKIYAREFYGDVIVDNIFKVDLDRDSEAFKAMYDVLENPMGYTDEDFKDDDIYIYGTNVICDKDIDCVAFPVIYDKGVWYYAD